MYPKRSGVIGPISYLRSHGCKRRSRTPDRCRPSCGSSAGTEPLRQRLSRTIPCPTSVAGTEGRQLASFPAMPGEHAAVLRGRSDERRMLERLLESARDGTSSTLVIRGEAGVGKTALLDYVGDRASGCRVVRAAGVESEMGYLFAGLLQLLRGPTLRNVDQLAQPQGDALRRAFGLQEGPPPETYLVCLATLTLLSQLAGERPLVCLIDDAQWLDRESLGVLSFVARRLAADPIVMLFGVREPSEPELDGLPEFVLTGLGEADARLLLESGMPGGLDRTGSRPDPGGNEGQSARTAGTAARNDPCRVRRRLRVARDARSERADRAGLRAPDRGASAGDATLPAPCGGRGSRRCERPRAGRRGAGVGRRRARSRGGRRD